MDRELSHSVHSQNSEAEPSSLSNTLVDNIRNFYNTMTRSQERTYTLGKGLKFF